MKKVILTVSMFAVSVSMASALEFDLSSYSISDLKSLMARINSRIVELEKAQTKACFVSNSDLSIGDGEAGVLTSEVKRLQDFLREKGYFQYKSTGYFGKLTRTALMSYQASVGVSQTGDFDAATRAKAHAGTCSQSKDMKNHDETSTVKKEVKTETSEKKKVETYTSKVSSISLSGAGANIYWKADGYSHYGYKLTWSKEPSPTYPPRSTDRAEYYSDQYSGQASLSGFSGSGVYYVRVCEYLNGTCGMYSNEIKVELQ